MNPNKLFHNWFVAFCLIITKLAYAADAVPSLPLETRDTIVEKETIPDQIQSATPNSEDLLRKQKLNSSKSKVVEQVIPKPDDLKNNARALEKEFAYQLAIGNKTNLAKFIELYRQVEDRDESLIEWAQAALLADTDLEKSIHEYRVLAGKFPENDFIRFQLAKILFYNQEFDAAQEQFQKLRASSNVTEADIAVFDQFLEQIANKNKWNFTFGVQYLNDGNITESADVGTTVVLPNGATLTQNSPKEVGHGINYNIGASKQWSLNHGKYVQLDSEFTHKYYWDNKKYNELNAYAGLGLGYANARLTLQATPYIMQRWYAGGSSQGSNRLKPYTQSLGMSLMGSYWLKPSIKYVANYNGNYEKYRDDAQAKRYDGSLQSVGNTLIWLASPKQYWGVGVNFTKRNAKNDTSSYNRTNARIFWGQEWPKGFATRADVSVAKRHYREANFLGKQKNTEYNTRLSLWHKAVHFKGFTPRLTLNYQKTKSNIPLYSFNKKQAFIEVNKTF